jgi:SAM-dependent methyltransferase
MDGYTDSTYGDRFADVYDDWYHDVSDVDSTVEFLAGLTTTTGQILELGIGTGRLALPLASRGMRVVGIDSSGAMLAKLAAKDPRHTVTPVLGDMLDDMPAGPFDVVFVAYNTFFGLLTAARQAACFAAVAQRLTADGAFVIEAFVPEPPTATTVQDLPTVQNGTVSVRSITVDRVVLAVSRHDADSQTASGQYIEISEQGGVRLRPWQIRFSGPDELDAMAAAAGLVAAERYEQFDRTPFGAESPRHVTVYRTIHSSVHTPAARTS